MSTEITTEIYRHMHTNMQIHVHGHAVGLRHKKVRTGKERHERHMKDTDMCYEYTKTERYNMKIIKKTKKDHMYM